MLTLTTCLISPKIFPLWSFIVESEPWLRSQGSVSVPAQAWGSCSSSPGPTLAYSAGALLIGSIANIVMAKGQETQQAMCPCFQLLFASGHTHSVGSFLMTHPIVCPLPTGVHSIGLQGQHPALVFLSPFTVGSFAS